MSTDYHNIFLILILSNLYPIFILTLSYYPNFVKALPYKNLTFGHIFSVTVCGEDHDFQITILSKEYVKIIHLKSQLHPKII